MPRFLRCFRVGINRLGPKEMRDSAEVETIRRCRGRVADTATYLDLLGFSWAIVTRFQAEFAAAKGKSNLIVSKDTEAASCGFGRLIPVVESFIATVTEVRHKRFRHTVKAGVQHPCFLLDGIEPTVD